MSDTDLTGLSAAEKRALLAERLRTRGAPRRRREFPVSFGQRRMWFLDQLTQGGAAYNVPGALRVHGDLDVESWHRACRELVRRHEILRTVYREADGEPVQVVADSGEVEFGVEDCTTIPADRREEEIQRLAREEFARPFDLATGPLLRMKLLRLGTEEHVLLLTLHHIAGDLWSTSVAFDELIALYGAYRTGGNPELPALPIQYADYAVWQREQAAGGAHARSLEYWRQALADAPPALELPTSRPRPALQTSNGSSFPFELSGEPVRRLREVGRAEGATLFMATLAAYQLLLHRYSGQDEVVVGVPVANRQRAETERLMGLFTNILPLRTDLSGGPTFRELVRRVRQVCLSGYAHQEAPFDWLVEQLDVRRDASRSPVFQATFLYQNIALPDFAGVGLRLEPIHVPSSTAKFDVEVQLFEREDSLEGWFEYNTDLFDADVMRRMARHLRLLVERLTRDPDRPVSEVPLLTDEEERALRDSLRGPTPAWEGSPLVHRRIAEQAARTPDAPALVAAGERLTYRELDRRANGLAHRLVELGVGRGVLAGICMDRSADLVIALLAVLKAGGAYVPLDPGFPPDRLTYSVQDSGLTVLLTQRQVLGRTGDLGGGSAAVVCVDDDVPAVSDSAPEADTGPADPAYVIYTSGSTGRPKGVQIPHGALDNLLRAMRERPGIAAGDTLFAVTTFAFDIAMLELLLPLAEGARLVVADRRTAADGELLAAALADSGATMMQATPTTWQLLLDAGWRGGPGFRALSGGEALPPRLARGLLAAGVTLWNMYGPTETTIWSSAGRVTDGPVTLGEPIAHTQFLIRDAAGQLVPPGTPGELCIGGAGLATGYLGRPDLTAERFPVLPDGERLYRTGDLVRLRPDGGIEYLGRLDHQVKLRGFRIELGEIESVLAQQAGVKDAVAAVREDNPGDQQLVAYVVSGTDDTDGLFQRLRSGLREKLPEYMVPTAFVRLDALPLTPNGKVDRKALPAPAGGRGALRSAYVAPRDETEERLCALFGSVLAVPDVGVEDSFFDLGGHSLLATRLVSRIRAAFAAELPVRSLFEAPTVAGLAQRLRHAADPTRPALVPVERSAETPLSFVQRRLWFLHRMEGPSATYNIPGALRLTGELDVDALHTALQDVIVRHEPLRTLFPDADGIPCRRVLAPGDERLRRTLPVGEADEGRLAHALDSVARYAFDLTTEIPLHARLFRLGERDHVLALTVHHIAADGWSLAPLIRDVATAYTARRQGRAPDWTPLPVQYADYTEWQNRLLGDPEAADSLWSRQLAYWREALDDLPERLVLPTDRPHPAQTAHRGETVAFHWGSEVHEGIARLARAAGATPFMVVQTALAALFHRLGAGTDIPLGASVAGRTDQATEDLVGPFVNSLVLRADVSGRPTFRELLARVRERSLDAYAHQDLPFEALVEALHPARTMAHHPLFQVMTAWQNTPDVALDLPGLRARVVPVFTGTARMDLSFLFEERHTPGAAPGAIDGYLEYSTELFDPESVQRLLDRLHRLLTQAVADPDRPVGDLDLLTPAEEDEAVTRWNDTRRPVPHATLADLFEAQAARTPDHTAVVSGTRRLTYAELDSAAAGLARRLQRLGTGTQSAVALLMERSADLVVAILAVLKAGGAYVPLDPRYPLERRRLIIAETGARVLLVDDAAQEYPREEGVHVLTVDEAAVRTGADEGGSPVARPGSDPHDLAYVMYTSGSTGTPKGIQITQRNVVSLACDQRWRNGCHSRVLMHSPTAFDASTYELWVPLLSGGTVVVAPPGHLDPEQLVRTITGHEVTGAFFTTALFNLLVEQHPAALAGIREVWTGGEAASSAAWARALERCPDTAFVHVYGPTEATTFALCHPFASDGSVPIGLPMDNTRAYVLDEGRRPVPLGVPGELYLAGDGLARGYLGQPELTAERFVADPFAPPGERMYRTGDLVRRRPDGLIEYLGRTDDQVKIRGFRIEPGEIEAVLATHPHVTQAAVAVHPGRGGKDLVGYVVPAGGAALDPAAVREFVSDRLPAYMVPVAVLVLDALPLTANEKVDRRALPAPDLTAAVSRAPRTPEERALCAVFADVLGVPEVGAEDGFFDRGGDSIHATQLVARARAAGFVITVRDVFTHQSPAALATAVGARRATGAEGAQPVVPRADRSAPLRLSFAQEEECVRHPRGPWDSVHNTVTAHRIRGPLDTAALRRSLEAIVSRHEALRTRVLIRPEGPGVQEVTEDAVWPLSECDLTAHGPDDRETELRTVLKEERDRRFAIDAEPLVRGRLVRTGPDEHVLVLTMHHLVTDNWSYGVLTAELRQFYAAETTGERPELPELPVQFPDVATWQQRRLAEGALDADLAYWRERLSGPPAVVRLSAPPSGPGTAGAPLGATQGFAVDGVTTAGLHTLSKEEDVTLFMTLLAAYQVLLSAFSGSDDVTVNFPVAGRQQPETEHLIGFFVNTVLVRSDLSAAPTFRDLLAQVRAHTLDAYAHQGVPLSALGEDHAPRPELRGVSFNLLNATVPELALPGLTVAPLERIEGDDYVFSEVIADFERSQLDLVLIMREEPGRGEAASGGLRGMWLHPHHRFPADTVAALTRQWPRLLELIGSEPDLGLDELRRRVLAAQPGER